MSTSTPEEKRAEARRLREAADLLDQQADEVDDNLLTFDEAINALIQQQYESRVKNHLPGWPLPTIAQVALETPNIRIAYEVFGESGLGDLRYDDYYKPDDDGVRPRKFGVFDNCREYGLTVRAGDWTFCVYEHRNSDSICIEGCPTSEAPFYGPYGGEDKYDTLATYGPGKYAQVALCLAEMIDRVTSGVPISRASLKAIGGDK